MEATPSVWQAQCEQSQRGQCTQDTSKYLKHDQIVAVSDAVLIAPQQSAAQLRHNMAMAGPSSPGKHIEPSLLRSVQRRVLKSRAQLTVQKLEGRALDASYGSLTQLANAMWFRTLVERNNDPDHEYHFNLFSPVIICRDVQAANDILHLNVTSPWFLLNVLRGITTGWVFQLNGDATFSFFKSAVDMTGPSSPGNLIEPSLLRSVQRRVSKSRAQLTVRKMEGLVLDASSIG